jgi:hypothetical protein
VLLPDTDADAAATLLFTLMPGLILAHHLSEPLTAKRPLHSIHVLANITPTGAG